MIDRVESGIKTWIIIFLCFIIGFLVAVISSVDEYTSLLRFNRHRCSPNIVQNHQLPQPSLVILHVVRHTQTAARTARMYTCIQQDVSLADILHGLE